MEFNERKRLPKNKSRHGEWSDKRVTGEREAKIVFQGGMKSDKRTMREAGQKKGRKKTPEEWKWSIKMMNGGRESFKKKRTK